MLIQELLIQGLLIQEEKWQPWYTMGIHQNTKDEVSFLSGVTLEVELIGNIMWSEGEWQLWIRLFMLPHLKSDSGGVAALE